MSVFINKLPIIITSGEPAGIGPDIIIKLAQQVAAYPYLVIGDPTVFASRAKNLGLPLTIECVSAIQPCATVPAKTMLIYPVALRETVTAGTLNVANADNVLTQLQVAVKACLNHSAAAMITAPVHKGIINQAGYEFTGHTQYLAALSQAPAVAMLFISESLRLGLVTDHLPLKQVANQLTQQRLTTVLRLIQNAMQRYFKLTHPRINVCGLNPHAGENGYLGKEEGEVLEPVIKKLLQEGFALKGPLSADTAFTPAQLAQSDVTIAMYHDQGLPVFKHLTFGKAVNMTLGLPFIRTSVDHGTALTLAGSGQADESSLRYVFSITEKLLYATAA